MANVVTNRIKIKGNIEAFHKAILNEEGKVDFNKVIEMPKELDITADSFLYKPQGVDLRSPFPNAIYEIKVLQDRIQLMLENFYSDEKSREQFVSEILDETVENPYFDKTGLENLFEKHEDGYVENFAKSYWNFRKFGYTSWYDWSINKWGTKDNADCTMVWGDMIEFDTKWSSPMGVYKELAKRFDFSVAFADEDLGSNFGCINFKNGEAFIEYDESKELTSEEKEYISQIIWECEGDYEEEENAIGTDRAIALRENVNKYVM